MSTYLTHLNARVGWGTSQCDRLRAWESAMRRGTDAARCGERVLAEGLYLEALAVSRSLLDHSTEADGHADDCVAAFVVTHLNLADLHADAEHTAQATAVLCAAHRTLMSMLSDAGADPALQRAACRHSRETHAALLEHIAQHGSDADVVAALRAGCMPFVLQQGRPAVHTLH